MLSITHCLLLHLKFTVEEDLLLLVFDDEAGLGDGATVVTLVVLLLVTLLIGRLGVRFAIEDHLLPGFKALEDVKNILELCIMLLRWVHESSVLQAVVLE